MAKQTINLGTAPTGAGGDTNRSAFAKAQANFDELYATGGIVSTGNNNGTYTKFPDGTMICWHNFTGYVAGTLKSFDWPAPFTTDPSISASVNPASGYDYQWMVWGNTASWNFRSEIAAPNNRVYVTAVGRWK